MDYQVREGKIISETGVPHLPQWFCDDQVVFEVDKHGISKVEYFNKTTKGQEKVFVDDMWGGMRFFIERNGYHYGQNLTHCELSPYGFRGIWEYEDFRFDYEQRVINDSVFVAITPRTQLPGDIRFAAEHYDAWRLIIRTDGDVRYRSGVERVWGQWEFDGSVQSIQYREGTGFTGVAIGSNVSIDYVHRPIGFQKHILTLGPMQAGQSYIFVMAFDESQQKAKQRAAQTLGSYEAYIAQQEQRYRTVYENSPVLESGNQSLNNFFALAPLYHESCKVPSVPGAIRAKTEHYWVWGWDGMSSSFAYAYWGDADYIPRMLEQYMVSADPEKGIGHKFARDMSHIETSMIPAQGFYISLLYQHYLNGGDIMPYYAFARRIYQLILSTEEKGTGLCKGYSLVPDFRETILENGNDLSAFNNSSAYCAVRAMAELAVAAGDGQTQAEAEAFAERMKEGFLQYLYNEEKGFFCASADAATLEKRNVYMSPAIKWDNLFCYDLVKDNQKAILKFFEENFVCNAGLMFAPVWGVGYDVDANQMHCYWPSNNECYVRLTNFENRKDLVDKFVSWITCWTDILMCPEGIDCYNNANVPKPDGWNAVNGTWQAYSMRAWYEATVHSVLGVDFAKNGMNIYPYDGEEMTLKNLHYNRKTFDIHMKGSGCSIEKVVLNGEDVGAVREIAMDRFLDKNTVEIYRYK